ncbi:C-type lectin domain family 2 member D-like [Chelydra serpentina]|uniref:C-type lectin domain family 2 member D-like n=1 Tax=Chelydra serpentina TaxID=8475 RepID=A0A8T1RY25_CHESE|nr:C-type lectin domain family 2 member D-like [Chelydra serpentina]
MHLTQRKEPENSAEDPLNNNGDRERAGKPGGQRWAKPWKHCTRKFLFILVTIAFIVIVVLSGITLKLHFDPPGSPAVPWCPDGWVGYLGKCYYFSEAEGNWSYSQSYCSSFGASLATIDTLQEKAFMLRYKGLSEHWIGLWREEGDPWRWVNGAEFNNLFEIRADGNCAYLNDNAVGSSWCHTLRNWICAQRDAYARG